MAEHHIFISDVHLGAFKEEKNEKIEHDLLGLIQFCTETKSHLYILGDLFDYWMEYPNQDHTPSLGLEVLDALENYNARVKPALYITGNHDNWTFGHFVERGFDVENEYRIITINQKNYLLMHGDGSFGKREDLIRPGFHRVLRNKIFIKTFQTVLPAKVGLKTMKTFSAVSKLKNVKNPVPLNNHAETILKNQDVDFVLMGHDHVARKETFTNGTYINLGPFFEHRTVALHNNDHIDLVKWQANTKEFVPFEK